jgi:uncharacterized protein (DUF983 family)
MAFSKTKIGSILTFKCPSCRKGEMFKGNAYSNQISEMNEKCLVCGEDFKREPGFYFGAAYVSYALGVALWVALYVAMILLSKMGLFQFSLSENPITFIIIGIVLLLSLLPLLFRLSRVMWLGTFVKYKKKDEES